MDNFIFGIRPIIEALKSGQEIDKVLIKKGLVGSLAGELFVELRKRNIRVQHVPAEKIDKISPANNQGVVAYLSPVTYQDIEDVIEKVIDEKRKPLILILDGITDVRNFGAIARTAECMGVDAIVIPTTNSVRITEDAIKTSAGALYNIPVCKVDNLIDVVLLLQQLEINVIAATEKSDIDISEADLVQATAIVMGSEDRGVSPQLLKRVNKSYKVPIVGKTESLNVSVAAAMFIYESVRQRLN